MKKLSSLESTVILGLNGGSEIRDAWNQVLQECEFGDLPHSINRSLPMVFKALNGNSDVLEYKRLAGIARKNWVENMGRAQRLMPVLAAASDQGIKIVILKGMAISFLKNDFASRLMGDTDLLIKKSDQQKMSRILLNLGYEPRFNHACTHRESIRDIFIDAFVDSSGNIIDVHTTGEASYFFKEIWENSATINFMGQTINIPQNKHILMHSLKHGSRGVASSDLMQTVLDFVSLRKEMEVNQLMKESIRWGLQRDLIQLNEILGIESSPVLEKVNASRESFSKKVIRLLQVRKEREISFKLAYKVSKASSFYRIRYFLWISLSSLRPLEKLIIENYGGFVKAFTFLEKYVTPQSIESLNPFKSNEEKQYEIRFGIEGNFHEIIISSKSQIFAPHLLFINGNLAGIIEPNITLVATVEKSKNLRYELSIRQPYGRCYTCSENLSKSMIYCS